MKEIYLALIVLLANIVEAISGFGSVIIAVTLGANLYDIDKLISILLPISLCLSTYIVTKHHKFIRFNFIMKEILPFMTSGLIVGLIILNYFPVSSLKNIYGVLVLILSIKELYFMLVHKNKERKELPSLISAISIFLAGIVHGLYASGGPLLVYGLSSKKLDKDVFRVTLSTIWLIFNLTLFIVYLFTNRVSIENLKISAFLIPTLILGIYVGEKVHHKINERVFRISVFSILLIAGLRLSLV
ncbi:MAG: sulfite exporter TauE/SafE family protein [Candidatus Sericytochromatia bacterium]